MSSCCVLGSICWTAPGLSMVVVGTVLVGVDTADEFTIGCSCVTKGGKFWQPWGECSIAVIIG